MNLGNTIEKIRFTILEKDYDHERPDIPRSKDFTKAVGNLLKKMFPSFTVRSNGASTSPTFVLRDSMSDKLIYVSIPDYRYENWYERILYRTMAYEKDWTGGMNHFANIRDLEDGVNHLVRR